MEGELTAEKRATLLEFHPILEKNYRLPTPMLERTYAVIRERVWMKRTGVYLYASPSRGKTVCAEQVQALLLLEFPRLHIMSLSASRSLRPSAERPEERRGGKGCCSPGG